MDSSQSNQQQQQQQQLIPYLSQELLLQILYKLPIKSLIRFRVVCKYWHSLFTYDPHFTLHYTSNTNPTPSYIYLLNYPTHRKLDSLSNFTIIRDSNELITPPLSSHNLNFTVVGSINGVVCLAFDYSHFILWNPSTRDSNYVNYVPPSGVRISDDLINKCELGFCSSGLGFGSGLSRVSFGIIRVVWKICVHGWRNGDPYCCTPELKAELYDLSTKNWTMVDNVPKSFLLCMGDRSVTTTVKGILYWCTYTWHASIISFSPSLGKFIEFDGPGNSMGDEGLGLSRLRWCLGEISETLSAFRESVGGGGVDVWKMVSLGPVDGGRRVVSWVKQFRVEPLGGLGKVVQCWKDGELVVANVVDCTNGKVVRLSLYDPWTKNSRSLLEFPIEKGRLLPQVFLCIETLVSPGGYTVF